MIGYIPASTAKQVEVMPKIAGLVSQDANHGPPLGVQQCPGEVWSCLLPPVAGAQRVGAASPTALNNGYGRFADAYHIAVHPESPNRPKNYQPC